jgi:hypothetical protein
MTPPVKPRTHKRAPAASRTPARAPAGEGALRERPARLPDGPAGPPRISIESLDDTKTGSIQTVPAEAPESKVAGFIETADDDQDSDSHLPPCLEPN